MAQTNLSVDVKNVKETMSTLKRYAPEQAKIINKKIRTEANKVRDRARDYMPTVALSNWNNWPEHASDGYVGAVVKKNIKTSKASYRQRGMITSNYIGIINADAAGAIFQTAGRGPSTDMFVENILSKSGNKRGTWKAFDELKSEVQPAIMEAVKEAQEIVNQEMAAFQERLGNLGIG